MAHPYLGKRVENEHGMVGTVLSVHNDMAHVEYARWRPDDDSGYAILVINLSDLTPPSPAPPQPGA
jgi:hypothetical protein